jgi:predicted glycogen debranching enzyme
MQDIRFDHRITQNIDEAMRREWLEANGLGGWASSTITGANSRRYHGLLVASAHPPVGRTVLLSKLDETIVIDNQRFELSTNIYPGAVHPQGYRHLQQFYKGLFPVFTFETAGVRLRKTVAAVNGENTTLLLYEVLNAPAAFALELRPFVAGRDYHSLVHSNDAICRDARHQDGIFSVQAYAGIPEFFISIPGATFESDSRWYYNFEYPVERDRGQDSREDLFTYGVFKCALNSGDRLGVIISTENPSGRSAFELFEREKGRRDGLRAGLPPDDGFAVTLALAADQFLVRRGQDLRTIIAGYHWFTDWGRDTMIALPGIALVTGRFADAKKILRAFAEHTSQGMLPNRFSDAGEAPEYNTVDATLWFFVAVYKYLQYTRDEKFVNDELMPVLLDILQWHQRGTRYRIQMDVDGLLSAGEPGVQLTWMDAKIGDWVVTPRTGKAVEINALWYNAFKIMAELSKRFGRKEQADLFAQQSEVIQKRFMEVFWYDAGGYLYDVVDGDRCDTSIRPNQIFALSLPFALVVGERAKQILRIITAELYTPFGLRSLSPQDAAYRPFYSGNGFDRDSAYHQGTVWGWLLGAYLTALVRVEDFSGREKAKRLLENLKPHLADAGVGTISEIFDGTAPHTPRGCMAQAWSVAEVLRAYVEEIALH